MEKADEKLNEQTLTALKFISEQVKAAKNGDKGAIKFLRSANHLIREFLRTNESGADNFEFEDFEEALDDVLHDVFGDEPDEFKLNSELIEDLTSALKGSGSSENDLSQALSSLKKSVIEQSSDDAETLFNLGITYTEMGLFNDAITQFAQSCILALKSRNIEKIAECLYMISVAYQDKEDLPKALMYLEQLLEIVIKFKMEEEKEHITKQLNLIKSKLS